MSKNEESNIAEDTQKKELHEYMTRKNIVILSVISIGVFSWLAPEHMKAVLNVIWSIIY